MIASKILHVWGPGFQHQFGGHFIFWKFVFANWDDDRFTHYFISDDFEIRSTSLLLSKPTQEPKPSYSRISRLFWAIKLSIYLILQKSRYDIIHVHTSLWGGLLAAPIGKLLGKPTIFESVLEGADNPSAIASTTNGKFILWFIRQFSIVLSLTSSITDDFKDYHVPVVTIPNCVDTDIFSPAKTKEEKSSIREYLGLPREAYVILFVGSVKHRKGVDILVDLFCSLAPKYDNLYLIIVGPKTLQENQTLDMVYIENLMLKIQNQNLSRRVKFTGLIEEKKQLSPYYKTADVFLFPTRHEGLPHVLLEAAASELPIIVTHLTEIEEIIVHDKNGVFVPRDNVQLFIDATQRIINDQSLAQKIASNARKSITEKFTFKIWQEKVVKLYQDLYQK